MKMKLPRLFFKVFLGLALITRFANAQGESTYGRLYTFMQTSCAVEGCHSTSEKAGGLDLAGSGAADVYAKIYGQPPQNAAAAAKGHKLIYPGDPYRSFMFRKCNNGLDPTTTLDDAEGASMPTYPQPSTPKPKEIELLRQWILYGAPQTGTVVDTTLIANYYETDMGVNSMPVPPPPPPPGQGFQIHLGPFFMPPATEIEYFTKYPLDNIEGFEIPRLDNIIHEGYSHHFILYRYLNGAENYNEGLRLNPAHSNCTNVASFQSSENLFLPPGTAFAIPPQAIFDLNSHYINYMPDKIMAAHVYLNVFTQESGTALQEMQTELIPQTNLVIPPDGQPHTFTQSAYIANSPATMFLWKLSSHTHKLGKDFKIWRRNANGSKGEPLFDAAREDGRPDGTLLGYDYGHPPSRVFFPLFYPLPVKDGLIFEATYVNPGPGTVTWGATSNDEMMIALAQFTYAPIITDVPEEIMIQPFPVLYPNPASGSARLRKNGAGTLTFELFDAAGRQIEKITLTDEETELDLSTRAAGLYAYRFLSSDGTPLSTGKVVVD